MSEPTTTETSPAATALAAATTEVLPDAASAPQTGAHDEADHEPADATPGREAAKYRTRLREVEAERDQLRAEIDAVHEARVADFLRVKHTLTTKALWAAGLTLDDVRDETGQVTQELVQKAADTAGKALGVSARIPYAPSASGQGNVGGPIGGPAGTTFADAFAPRR